MSIFRSGKILPMINRENVKPFRKVADWMGNSRKSCRISCVLLVLSNIAFLILALAFALLYLASKNGIDEAASSSAGLAMPNWNVPTHSLLGEYAQAAVGADNEICSSIGRDILLLGGNAIEASIATQFCIGVMDTHSSGLGGGFLMTIYNATTKKCHVIDAREVAPLSSTEDMFLGRMDKSERGWESVAVPGELHGFWTAYTNFGGNISWPSLVEPTIRLMEEGYPTSHALAGYLRRKEQEIMANPVMKAKMTNPLTGKLFAPGEQIKTRPHLAETLKKLANATDPIELFYKGEMAMAMVEEFKSNGGLITAEDFAAYKAILRVDSDVIYTNLPGGRTICGPPPPSGSAVAQAILNVLDPISFNLTTFSGRVDFLHRYIEASKFAYAVRNSLGDMDFVPEAMEIARRINSPEWAQLVRSKMSWSTHEDAFYFDQDVPPSYQEDHGTAHVSVIDRWGNAVAITSTINLAFGSMVFSDSTGILWNDEMDDFSSPGKPNYWGYPPSPQNFIRPGKRPMSSMSPIIVFNKNGREVLSIGGAGGSAIISGVAGSAFNALWLDMNIKEAIDFPRFHNQLAPNETNIEARIPEEYLQALRQRGHLFMQSKEGGYFNVVTGVHRAEDGTTYANSDWRKGWESQPSGY